MSESKQVNIIFKTIPLSQESYYRSIIFYVILSVSAFAFSIWLYIDSSKIFQHTYTYYDPKTNCLNCTDKFTLTTAVQPPIYVMYSLADFYQNHRRYILSRSQKQLRGEVITAAEAKVCAPFSTNGQMGVRMSYQGLRLKSEDVASPCGSIAATFVNDTYRLSSQDGNIVINESGIAWAGDKGGSFKRSNQSASMDWIDPENEHLIVWMRTAGVVGQKKLWGRIETALPPGNYTLSYTLNYKRDTSTSRTLIITTLGVIGGKNYVLPTALFILGVLGSIAVGFFCKRYQQFKKRNQI